MFQNCNIALLGGNNDECVAVSNIYPYGPGKCEYVLLLIYQKNNRNSNKNKNIN